MAKETITYYSRWMVERVSSRGVYTWRKGYTRLGENGGEVYPCLTRAECHAEAHAQGKRAVFVGLVRP